MLILNSTTRLPEVSRRKNVHEFENVMSPILSLSSLECPYLFSVYIFFLFSTSYPLFGQSLVSQPVLLRICKYSQKIMIEYELTFHISSPSRILFSVVLITFQPLNKIFCLVPWGMLVCYKAIYTVFFSWNFNMQM